MVRQPGAGDPEGIGEVGRVGGGLAQGEQEPAADRVGECTAEPHQHEGFHTQVGDERPNPSVEKLSNLLGGCCYLKRQALAPIEWPPV